MFSRSIFNRHRVKFVLLGLVGLTVSAVNNINSEYNSQSSHNKLLYSDALQILNSALKSADP